MNKKISHIILLLELVAISLFHTAKFYREGKKTAYKQTVSYKKPFYSFSYTALQHP